MPKQQEPEQAKSPAAEDAPRSAAISALVMRGLGRPAGLYAVQVRPLWERHYRVNVLVGANAADVRIAHSYFLTLDGEGNLGSSDPEIVSTAADGPAR